MKRKHYKDCPFCGGRITTKTKLCPFCHQYLTNYLNGIVKKNRNKQIADEVKSGIPQRQLGRKYGVSNVRIKEIYDRFK